MIDHSGDWPEGDFDGDGLVGPRDAAILAANWGATSESSAVPLNRFLKMSTVKMISLPDIRRRELGHQ